MGWNDHQNLLGRKSGEKVGSFQPNTRPLRAQIAQCIKSNFFSVEDLLNFLGKRDGDVSGELGLSGAVHFVRS